MSTPDSMPGSRREGRKETNPEGGRSEGLRIGEVGEDVGVQWRIVKGHKTFDHSIGPDARMEVRTHGGQWVAVSMTFVAIAYKFFWENEDIIHPRPERWGKWMIHRFLMDAPYLTLEQIRKRMGKWKAGAEGPRRNLFEADDLVLLDAQDEE